jgi:hypothetical protein
LEAFQQQNVLQKAMSMRQNVLLVEKKGKMQAELDEAIKTYPLASNPMEMVKGPNGLIFPSFMVAFKTAVMNHSWLYKQYSSSQKWPRTLELQNDGRNFQSELGPKIVASRYQNKCSDHYYHL